MNNNLENQEVILNEEEKSYIVLQTGEDEKKVLVLFPGGIGTLTQYQNLLSDIEKLSTYKRNIVGFELVDREGFLKENAAKLISKMGLQYGKILVEKNFESYQMVGYCFGGLVALEAAQYLISKGKNVEMVYTIDTLPNETFLDSDLLMERSFTLFLGVDARKVGHTVNDERLKAALEKIVMKTGGRVTTEDLCTLDNEFSDIAECYRKLEKETHEERLREMVNCVPLSVGKVSEDELNKIETLYQIFYQTSKAVWSYKPQKYNGDVTILACKDTATSFLPKMKITTQQYIESIVKGTKSVKWIEGNHGTCVISPWVESIAKIIVEGD
ncbi:enterobactin synthase subunit F [Clostridiales bacterium CHKCI001]|nr:enterobactin synthase subunit F [Clostridiales bacterium CHKCI001]